MQANTKFQYYNNKVVSSCPEGFITLNRFLDTIKNPKQETKDLLNKIVKASKNEDKKLKSELKKRLYSFTPCVIVDKQRTYESIIYYTGLAVLDFDKIDNVIEFKEFLFNEYKQIIAAWLSPSKKGIKALVKIPIVKTKEEFKSYSWGLSAEMEIYKGFDIVVNNAVLLTFIGYDKDILIRDNAEMWTKKGIQINSFDLSKVKPFVQKDNVTSNQTDWVVNLVKEKINNIYDNGHPTLRGVSVMLGGYVSGGYVSQLDAIHLMENLIMSNRYLQKGVSGYIKTAKQAIYLGMKKPLSFDN